MKLALGYLALAFITACSTIGHRLMEGTVALKIDNSRGIACLESGVAKVGMKMKLLNNDCSQQYLSDIRAACSLVEMGEIRITKILNEHYAEFEKISGKDFREGSIVADQK